MASNAWSELKGLARTEFGQLRGRPKLWGACLVIMAIPSVYALTYLSSVWDPYGQLDQLPVALVNQDQGTAIQGRALNLGQSVLRELETRHTFAFRRYATEAEAKRALDDGGAYFALVVPSAFSRMAVAGDSRHPATLSIVASQGTSYMASTLGKRFGEEVAHGLNETLGENRWRLTGQGMGQLRTGVLALTSGAERLAKGSAELADGATQLASGSHRAAEASHQLVSGSGRLAGGVNRLTEGTRRLGAGIRLMAEKSPQDSELDRLAAGSAQVASGLQDLDSGLGRLTAAGQTLATKNAELADGLDRLKAGSLQLTAGSTQLTTALGRVPLVGGQLAAGSGKLQAGLERLDAGLGTASLGAGQLADGTQRYRDGVHQAHQGAERLATGSAQVDAGVQRLTTGVKQLSGGLRTMARALPSDRDLATLQHGGQSLAAGSSAFKIGLERLEGGSAKLQHGARQLADGNRTLSQGLETLYAKLPGDAQFQDPSGTARPVTSTVEYLAPVANNGTAFSPYFIGLSLWMGAVMTAFLFHFIVLPESMRGTRQRHRMLAKGLLPSILVLGQATIMAVALRWGLHLKTPNVGAYYTLLLTGGLSFVSIVLALILLLGDAGKLTAVVLLVLQLAAAGGAFPVELAPAGFQWLHPYLPITNLIKAFRASQFGSYGGHWWTFELRMVLAGLIAALTALAIGRKRWKFVPDGDYGPALDL
ncbi:MAG TPA: YhgE/Pip domain-containing protein [Stenomitos sp.]